jgi:hypothetical protein
MARIHGNGGGHGRQRGRDGDGGGWRGGLAPSRHSCHGRGRWAVAWPRGGARPCRSPRVRIPVLLKEDTWGDKISKRRHSPPPPPHVQGPTMNHNMLCPPRFKESIPHQSKGIQSAREHNICTQKKHNSNQPGNHLRVNCRLISKKNQN